MVLATSAFVATASAQPQQTYPNRPIRFVVALATGGAGDIAARLFGQKLADAFGQQVVIDNRPGAGGIIGAELAAKASPDGYTLMMASSGYTVLPSLHKKLAAIDFEPVGNTPEEFGTFIKKEVARWGKVVKESGAKLD